MAVLVVVAEVLAAEEQAPAGDRAAATVVERRTAKHGVRAILCRDGLTRASTWSNALSFSSARTTKRFPPRCTLTTVRPRKDHRGFDLISDALPFRAAVVWRSFLVVARLSPNVLAMPTLGFFLT